MVKIGSARNGENGATGNKAGDQSGAEVSTQNWYLHSKGWVVLRPKSEAVAEKIAYDMQAACDNQNIGYDQNDRNTLYTAAKAVGFDCAKVKTKVETDCSALVRVCCAYAGISVPDFTTANESAVLTASGAFERLSAKKYTESTDYLKRGDILVTKTKGHTAVVLEDGAKVATTPKNVKATQDAKSFDRTLAGTYTTTTALNMRSGAGTLRTSVMVVLPQGTKVRNYGYYTKVDRTEWLYVVAEIKGVTYTGFCSGRYLKKSV